MHLYQYSKGDGDANETYRDNNIHENIKVKLEAKSFLFVIIDSWHGRERMRCIGLYQFSYFSSLGMWKVYRQIKTGKIERNIYPVATVHDSYSWLVLIL